MCRNVYVDSVGTRSKRTRASAAPLVAGFLLLALNLGACGGGEIAPGSRAQSGHDAANTATHEQASDEPDTAPEQEAPALATCGDDSCGPCGAGLCPRGWYCDESAAGGPACGWLPECAQKSGCGCLNGKLGASCKCSEQGASVHVTCK